MSTLTGSSKIVFSRTYSRTVEMASASAVVSFTDSQSWATGDAVDSNQLLFTQNDLAIAGSGGSATDFDLVSGLTDPLTGTAQTWTKVKEIYIKNNTTTAGATVKINGNFITTVLLGGTSPFLTIGAGGSLLIRCPSLAGYAVTSSTGDTISIQGATSAAVNIDLVLVGTGSVA